MKHIPLEEKDRMHIQILQLQAENHRLQSLIYEMQLTKVVEELSRQTEPSVKAFDPVSLSWMVEEAP